MSLHYWHWSPNLCVRKKDLQMSIYFFSMSNDPKIKHVWCCYMCYMSVINNSYITVPDNVNPQEPQGQPIGFWQCSYSPPRGLWHDVFAWKFSDVIDINGIIVPINRLMWWLGRDSDSKKGGTGGDSDSQFWSLSESPGYAPAPRDSHWLVYYYPNMADWTEEQVYKADWGCILSRPVCISLVSSSFSHIIRLIYCLLYSYDMPWLFNLWCTDCDPLLKKKKYLQFLLVMLAVLVKWLLWVLKQYWSVKALVIKDGFVFHSVSLYMCNMCVLHMMPVCNILHALLTQVTSH